MSELVFVFTVGAAGLLGFLAGGNTYRFRLRRALRDVREHEARRDAQINPEHLRRYLEHYEHSRDPSRSAASEGYE